MAADDTLNIIPGLNTGDAVSRIIEAVVMRTAEQNGHIFTVNQVVWGIVNQEVSLHQLLVCGNNNVVSVQEGEQL